MIVGVVVGPDHNMATQALQYAFGRNPRCSSSNASTLGPHQHADPGAGVDHLVITSITLSVIFETVSVYTEAPLTSRRCAVLSPVVSPRAGQ
jgi:hypothetical protein